MLTLRVIPCLLLRGDGLIKTVKFKNERYVGDPINAIKIFNEKEVDELVVLDVLASAEHYKPRTEYVRNLATECFMPLCYGGGITTLAEMEALFSAGVEKVAINTAALDNPDLIRAAAKEFGSQSIVVSLDVKKSFFGGYSVYSQRGTTDRKISPFDHVKLVEDLGAGEIFLNSVDQDGVREGYDLDLLKKICQIVTIPVIACGGAGELTHFKAAADAGASAVAAGSFFVFYGKHRAVLITYPESSQIEQLNCPDLVK